MKQIQFIKIILLSNCLFLILESCSSDVSKEKPETVDKIEEVAELKTSDVKLEIEGFSCWINRMPGSEAPKFHITGHFYILDSKLYKYSDLKIKKLIISQANKDVYFIRPTQDEKIYSDDSKKQIRFSTLRGLRLVEELNSKLPVNIHVIFSDDNNEYSYYLDNINIEEAY